MEYPDQEYPAEAVIDHDRDKVVDRGDQRTRGYSRIDADLLEEHGDQCSKGAGNDHRDPHRNTDAGGNQIRKADRPAF